VIRFDPEGTAMEEQIGAGYIAEMAQQLADLARQHGLNDLAYILDIAVLEAELAAKRPPVPNPEPAA
jgi:hypothetical protein